MTTIKDYRLESVRLDSFKDWPYLWKKPEELAAAGFYYTGINDKVKCFMCKVELFDWKPEDKPTVEHKLNSRKCYFVNNIPCGNVPIGTDPSTIPGFVPRRADVCGIPGFNQELWFLANHGEKEERVNYWLKHFLYQKASIPKHPKYASYALRLASYDKWPKTRLQAEKLATAGFYYSGNSDETVCYYCNGQLKNWELNDDPWVKHAKWFHHCLYLVLTKGTEFINNVTGTTYMKKNLPFVVDTMEEKFEKTDNGNIASGTSQNSTNAEKRKPNLPNIKASDVLDGASNKEQFIQIRMNKILQNVKLCRICWSRNRQILFVPCYHFLTCEECATDLTKCICGKNIKCTVKANML
ncbi:PREDICTED: baculoviral IAP repeat-containing protein 3-like [Trachymyrmex cornetzi]|uniref:baculoviral IAP repeat-containing protein 3-like n=1 Tax=Trachymyrmex cornetzi TaxID=471704 RepID=UPI00084F02C3|nr:PREDICTED: baculoviral IAP repeat-containing protein 3-like [Trachymyrmex cornetzi]